MRDRKGEKVTIVGAGLTGSLLATGLAKRGFEVEVLERRGDMRAESVAAGRSINLALSVRGRHALKEVGLEAQVLEHAIPMKGRMMHAVDGKLTLMPYGTESWHQILSVSRAELNKTLMTAAEATGKVKIRFHERVAGMDFRTGALDVRDERSGQARVHETTRVIGTDGSASAIRADLVRLPRTDLTQTHLDYGYKELTIPAAEGGGFRMDRNALHIWPRGKYMLIALPNFDGSFTCTLFLPYEGSEASFEALTTPGSVITFFRKNFSDVIPLMPRLVDEFMENPIGHMVTVKCHPWHAGERALLIGDAAHAIVPFFGQGMNCGFEDCTVFWELIDKGFTWSRVFSETTRIRRPQADAIADLAAENFTEMRDKVGQARFLLEKEVERELQKRFPQEYLSRYALVTFSRVPYRLAQEAGEIQDRILARLCEGIETASQVNYDQARELVSRELTGHFGAALGKLAQQS